MGKKVLKSVSLAAGFDKNAEAVEGLLGLGFGFVEVGSVTPVPQEGNPKPRIFRLPNEGAIINRCGFNSEGIVAVAKRLSAQHGKRKLKTSGTSSPTGDEVKHEAGPGILGVNLGKNKTSEDAAADYVQGVHTLSQYADYLVINISSPNTPGLRQLQGRKQLKDLVKKVQAARDEMQWGEEGPPPLLVKIAPDLSKQDLEDIAAVTLALRVDGLIISNTTIQRPDSVSQNPVAQETGGLSGKPLFNVQAARDEMQWGEEGPPPLLVKIAPDLSKQDLEDIAAVTLALRVDGLIISNTTIQRPDSVSQNPVAQETGGLSGKPLFNMSTNILKEMYILTKGRIPLIGCGGISSGEDAYKKIRAGATLVQLYTAFGYGGPALIPDIKAELARCLERDGYKSIHEAIWSRLQIVFDVVDQSFEFEGLTTFLQSNK
ncbi:Dihydroorotate dehydrogenase (fumarate) [Datura stramonium]|uniref:Dihydroorotate dehydrogenase (quinone), mitochondrial n=1 Tax=Datura stramonium TaxID=4076 RepID=A0ABS8SMJ2_DATST|nr:Dihydroorotate dehydrogenase (fumarate) [Datura stramonium]